MYAPVVLPEAQNIYPLLLFLLMEGWRLLLLTRAARVPLFRGRCLAFA
jgi:hypothetical protein